MKKCFKCGMEKPIDEFYKHSKMADGYLGKCKECAKTDSTNRRWNKLEEVRHYDRNRPNKENRREKRAVYNKKYIEKNEQKCKAHKKVSNAVRDGRLVKMPCIKCGSLTVEAHHENYDKPLDVIWLCKPHHRQLHRDKRNELNLDN